MTILETQRLILRPFEKSDMESIYKLFSNKRINTYLPWFPQKNKIEAEDFYINKLTNTQDYQYAICLKEKNQPIGYINIGSQEPYDFGYGLLETHWRQGIVSEAGRAIISWAHQSGMPYITATHDVNNPHSGYVMKALGMTYYYTYEELWQPKNTIVNFRLYQLNFDNADYIYKQYWQKSQQPFIESL